MLDVNVINKLPDNKVLILEKDTKKSQPRYYIANEENADKFIKVRKNLTGVNNFQNVLTVTLAMAMGVLAGICVKGHYALKAIAGLIAGIGTIWGAGKMDRLIDKQAQKNNIKHYDVEEITQDKEKVEAALNCTVEAEA